MTETTPDPQNDEGDVKRRFREALERKQAQSKRGASHEDHGSKVHHEHNGPAATKREFRRKSG